MTDIALDRTECAKTFLVSVLPERSRQCFDFDRIAQRSARTVTFDEQGNYIPPEEEKKNGGSKSGWVN